MTKMFSTPSSRRAVLGGAVGAVGAGAALAASSPANASPVGRMAPTYWGQSHLYLQLTGITGDSLSEEFPGAIDLQDYEFGADAPVTNTAKSGTSDIGVGKSKPDPFSFSCLASKASPKLFQFAAQGKGIKTVTLNAVGSTQEAGEGYNYLTVKMENAFLTSYEVAASEAPVEKVSVIYSKITYTYRFQNESGTPVPVVGGFDWGTGKVVTG